MYKRILFGIFAWYAVNFSLHNLSVLKVDILCFCRIKQNVVNPQALLILSVIPSYISVVLLSVYNIVLIINRLYKLNLKQKSWIEFQFNTLLISGASISILLLIKKLIHFSLSVFCMQSCKS